MIIKKHWGGDWRLCNLEVQSCKKLKLPQTNFEVHKVISQYTNVLPFMTLLLEIDQKWGAGKGHSFTSAYMASYSSCIVHDYKAKL